MSRIVELEITDLAFNGKSVAHLDGKVTFVNGGLPGETVMARITRSKPRHNEAVLIEIVTRSEMRTTAPCAHFGTCGGCVWQDLKYIHQLHFKHKQVVDCLERIGKLSGVRLFDTIGSAELFNYRNKMEFSFHTTPDGGFTLGLHQRGRFDKVFDVENCLLQSPHANQIVAWVREYVRQQKIPVYDIINHTGYMRFLAIREARRTGQVLVNLVTNTGPMPARQELIKQMRAELPFVTTIIHNQTGSKSNVAVGEKENVLFGLGYIEEKLFDQRFRIRSNTFFQTNTVQTETLYRTAFEMLLPGSGNRVLDLYCGTGSIGIILSEYVREVVGVEIVEDAVSAARENAEVNNITNITFFHGDVKDYLKTDDATRVPFDTIVIDPPRAGLHPKAMRRLLRLTPDKVLYISCNPSTFARDAKQLFEAGYHLPEVRVIDMFPHTMHIELVGVFYQNNTKEN